MKQFNVYRYSEEVPFIIDVQANLLSGLKTRVVIPLLSFAQAQTEQLPKLKPIIQVKGESYILMTTDMGALHISALKEPIDNVEDQRQVIVDAIDFLFQGF